MKSIQFFLSVLLYGCVLTSCNKDYIIGGEKENDNEFVGKTNFEVLKSLVGFDTLVQVIEAADMIEEINQNNTTFFVPSDYSINNYLSKRTAFVQANYSASAKFGLDSLLYYVHNNIENSRDSLKMYLIAEKLPYSQLSATGSAFDTELGGEKAIVSYEFTRDGGLGYSNLVSSVPRIVYFTYLWHPYDLSELKPASDVPEDVGVRTRVTMSGLNTKNGIINRLESSHVLFFYNTKR